MRNKLNDIDFGEKIISPSSIPEVVVGPINNSRNSSKCARDNDTFFWFWEVYRQSLFAVWNI